ncbi:MAG: SAM-dependent methyltransferase [Anaerolineae bacterium]|nr:SAM-dependent methyltransferase [Anaerolineae bacterium]
MLYIVGVPAGDPDDLTLRARRTLREVACIIAGNVDTARLLLAHHGIETPLAAAGEVDSLLETVASGDVALLCDGWAFRPAGPAVQLIREATEQGVRVVPIPGPVLPVTALVLSGLPADSFVYLGTLPAGSSALEQALEPVIHEPRTLLAQIESDASGHMLRRLLELLGDRPMAVVASRAGSGLSVWRGLLVEAVEQLDDLPQMGSCILVIGGIQEAPEPWDADRLWIQVEAYLRQGLGVKEISHRLSEESGWPRRDVYALALRVRKGLQR